MGNIRKKTSKRGTTFQRSKITKKATEQRKKNKRSSNKDQTWKNKKKADPGIPNTFHLKDQVLAEIAEQKRQAEEAKLARREASKPHTVEEEEDTPGISSISSNVIKRPLSGTSTLPVTSEGIEDDDIPELVDTELATLQAVLDRADVVCQVVDARDIQGGRSDFVESMVKDAGAKMVLIVNKIDLVPRETLQAWLSHLPAETYLFKSAIPAQPFASSSKSPITPLSEPSLILGKTELLADFRVWATEKKSSTTSAELVIALIGLPSGGKTSVLNSLFPSVATRHAVAPPVPVAASAKHPEPTTKTPVEIKVDDIEGVQVSIIDTPGWEFAADELEDEEGLNEEQLAVLEAQVAGDLLRRNLGRVDRVKEALPLANYVISRSNAQDLMLAYNIPYFQDGDAEAFLTSLARVTGRVKKGDTPDLEGAARVLLRDWAYNAFPFYTSPPATSTGINAESNQRPEMKAVLERCHMKRDLKRTGKGLIRFRGGEVDNREIILDDDYTALAHPNSDEEDEEDKNLAAEDMGEGDDLDDPAEDSEEDATGDESEDETLIVSVADGEEVELEDGSEPDSGSDVPDEEDAEDAEEDEEEEEEEEAERVDQEEEEEEEEEELEAASISKLKRKRISISPKQATKKAKRIAFDRPPSTQFAPTSVSVRGSDAAPKKLVGILKKPTKAIKQEVRVAKEPLKVVRKPVEFTDRGVKEAKHPAKKSQPKSVNKAEIRADLRTKEGGTAGTSNGQKEAYDFSAFFK